MWSSQTDLFPIAVEGKWISATLNLGLRMTAPISSAAG